MEQTINYENGDLYVGEIGNGRRHGSGNYTYTSGKECRMFFILPPLYTVGWPERFQSHTVPVSRKPATKRNTVDLSGT